MEDPTTAGTAEPMAGMLEPMAGMAETGQRIAIKRRGGFNSVSNCGARIFAVLVSGNAPRTSGRNHVTDRFDRPGERCTSCAADPGLHVAFE